MALANFISSGNLSDLLQKSVIEPNILKYDLNATTTKENLCHRYAFEGPYSI